MWRFVESVGRVPIYENDLKVATASTVEAAARIVAAMNAAEAKPCAHCRSELHTTEHHTFVGPPLQHSAAQACTCWRQNYVAGKPPCPVHQPAVEPARKSVCGTCFCGSQRCAYCACPDCSGPR